MDKHYDVGIVGLWYGLNYGSVLTYYALHETICSMKLSTLMINKPEFLWRPRYADRNSLANRFIYKHCDVSEIKKERSEWLDMNNLCDTFIVGSDVVWNYEICGKEAGQFFFLDFVDDKKKKISAASSFGQGYSAPEVERALSERCLKRFDYISVRESEAADICLSKFGIKPEIIADPVFMCDRSVYDELCESAEHKESGGFLMTYILGPDVRKGEIIRIASSIIDMPIRSIPNPNNPDPFTERTGLPALEDQSVEDWLYRIKECSFFIGDSFHGLCFSLIFEKPFLVAVDSHAAGLCRFTNLLKRVGLEDRLIYTDKEDFNDKKDILYKPIDYSQVRKILLEDGVKSKDWLYNAINKPKIEKMPEKQTVKAVMDKSLCTGCGGCAELCPVKAIKMVKNTEGFFNPEINSQKCIKCGLCFNRCPSNNPQYNNVKNPKCYAVMAHDDMRKNSSSGGMFTIAAEHIIDLNGAVCGAAYKDDFDVEHIIIRDKKELAKLRGSKYIQSNASVVYSKIKELLDDNVLVLFSGMPCQVAGLYSFLSKDYNNLYTMDLLCHGIVSHSVFNKYRKDIFGDKELVKLDFKAKEPWGWHAGINAYFSDGSKYSKIAEVDPYFVAYLQGLSKNIACGICRFNRLPRQGDLTIGDFWKIREYDPTLDDDKGTSVVLVNNDKGARLFEKINSAAATVREAPLQTAISGNLSIEHSYHLHKNRDLFFENLNELPFDALVLGCKNNRLYEQTRINPYNNVSDDDMEFYLIAQAVARNYRGRKIVTWIRSEKFERILKKFFGLSVAFGVSMRKAALRENTVLDFDVLNGKAEEYYVVSFDRHYDEAAYQQLALFGYLEIKDFIFRIHKPIILEKLDLLEGNYYDEYGNSIEGHNSVIGRVVLCGFNNHIVLGNKISTAANLNFELRSNCYIEVGDDTRFNALNKFKIDRFGGRSTIIIGKRCCFDNVLWKLYNDENNSSIIINDGCTFGINTEFHVNSGKKIIIGKDNMFSYNIALWVGDGHAIFNVRTQKKVNSLNNDYSSHNNRIVLGNHVWVGTDAFIMHGTNIGNGSIIGARAVVKGAFPNNCSIGGNPAKLIRSDIAWSREMYADNIGRCGEPENAALTNSAKAPISGLNVLVVGGTRFMGIQLVKELIALGNNVTIATRGNVRDIFGLRVNRLKMDVSNAESVKNALYGKYFDVVFDNLAYCSVYADNILSNVECGKYIQLSSVMAYNALSVNMSEELFDPYALSAELCGTGVGYIKGKRQAEIIAYQNYPQFNIVTVRIPYVTPTDRLYYYCKNIVKQIPMDIQDTSHGFTFIRDTEVGKFLPWIAAQNFTGPINLASEGMVTIQMILDYIESKVGKKAVIDTENGAKSPFHEFNEKTFSQSMSKAERLGYNPSGINDWLWKLMDEYIERALKEI